MHLRDSGLFVSWYVFSNVCTCCKGQDCSNSTLKYFIRINYLYGYILYVYDVCYISIIPLPYHRYFISRSKIISYLLVLYLSCFSNKEQINNCSWHDRVTVYCKIFHWVFLYVISSSDFIFKRYNCILEHLLSIRKKLV